MGEDTLSAPRTFRQLRLLSDEDAMHRISFRNGPAMRHRIIFLAMMACAACCQAAEDPLDALRVYEGSWTNRIEYFDTAYSSARRELTELTNACWRSGSFYSCHQSVNGNEVALVVFAYDSEESIYRSFPIPVNAKSPASGTLKISGNVWTFPWITEDKGTKMYFRVTNTFLDADHIVFRQEFSSDQQTWTTTALGQESRVR